MSLRKDGNICLQKLKWERYGLAGENIPNQERDLGLILITDKLRKIYQKNIQNLNSIQLYELNSPPTHKVYEKELKLKGLTGQEPGFIYNTGYLPNNEQWSF